MSFPRREPYFLQGRTSVIQRAVLMSMVLFGLTAIAGWVVAMATFASGRHFVMWVLPPAWGLATGLLVYGPLHYWNRRNALWTVAAVLMGIMLQNWFIHLMRDQEFRWLSKTSREAMGFAMLLAGGGLLQVRCTRLHAVAYLLSVGAAIFPLAITTWIDNPGNLGRSNLGFSVPAAIALPMAYAALFGTWMAALAVPWGLPFWWPPTSVAAAHDGVSGSVQNSA